eukprot:jgi/Mesvir1/21370/Mv20854-RA.1
MAQAVSSVASVASFAVSQASTPASKAVIASRKPIASFNGLKAAVALPSSSSRRSLSLAAMPAAVDAATALVTSMSLEAAVGVFGNKAGMTSIFSDNGVCIPVTVIAIGDGNRVTQVKTPETDGYSAVQVGYKEVAERKITLPEVGHLKKSNSPPFRYLQEFRVKDVSGFSAGQELKFEEMFKAGDLVDVRGKSIGKGFQGGIKRHNFRRGLMSHGSKSHRELGTTGPGTIPGRTYPGKKMPGQLGNAYVKSRKLEVIRVDAENKCLLVRGTVPGKPGNLLRITISKVVGKNI